MNISDEMLLKRFGLRVHPSYVEEVAKTIREDPAIKKYVDKILNSLGTMTNEDNFIDAITSSHQSISEIPENAKVIHKRDNTFTIKAINSENIKSLTQRAFFNSFNLQRNVLNDLDEQNKNRNYNKPDKNPVFRQARGRGAGNDPEDEVMCICGNNIPGSQWVQCHNQNKCRGSNWYHLQCAGFDPKEIDNLKDKQFICEKCKKYKDQDGQDESVSESRQRGRDEESGC